MATLSVLKFDDPGGADRVLMALQGMQERSRSRSSFRPAKLPLTDPIPRSTAPYASPPPALPLPPLRSAP